MTRFGWSRRRLLLGVLVVAVIFVAALRAGSALVRTREIRDPDAILMLASHEWERLPELAARAEQTPAATVLLSVPQRPTNQTCYLCADRTDWLRRLGVDSKRVTVLPRPVTSTQDEARAALEFCVQRGFRRLLVVTSPYHTRRALATFEHVFKRSGVQVGVQPASAHSAAKPTRWWTAPYDRWYVRYEWAAIGFYAVRYGIIPGP